MLAIVIKNNTWQYVKGVKIKSEPGAKNATDIATLEERKPSADVTFAKQPSEFKQISIVVHQENFGGSESF